MPGRLLNTRADPRRGSSYPAPANRRDTDDCLVYARPGTTSGAGRDGSPHMELGFFTLLLFMFLSGITCGTVASDKNREKGAWFAIGFFTGFFGIIMIACMSRREPKPKPQKRNAVPAPESTNTAGHPTSAIAAIVIGAGALLGMAYCSTAWAQEPAAETTCAIDAQNPTEQLRNLRARLWVLYDWQGAANRRSLAVYDAYEDATEIRQEMARDEILAITRHTSTGNRIGESHEALFAMMREIFTGEVEVYLPIWQKKVTTIEAAWLDSPREQDAALRAAELKMLLLSVKPFPGPVDS